MLPRVVAFLFLSFCVNLIPAFGWASLFDWSVPLSPKAERARLVLEGLDPLIEKALRDFNIPGLALGVVVDGHLVIAKGYGVRDLQTEAAVNAQTIFPIGSCTKSFTTFAFGLLAQQQPRLLGWDQIVSDVLPEFRLQDKYASQHATFRDLASNRTGLSRHDFMWYNSTYSREELLRRVRYLAPLYPFRERYYYNSLMYVITGMAIEKVSGKTWEEYVRAQILQPLKMNSTSFSIEDLQKESNIATPYIEKEGALKKMAYRAFNNVAPTAAMNSNVDDLSHWMKMLLAQGLYDRKQLISPTAIQEMQSPQVISAGYPEFNDLLINSYGLGWDILSYRGHYCVGHDGGVDGFTSALCLLPSEGIGVVVLSNKNLASLPRFIAYEVFDRVLELPQRGWFQLGLERIKKNPADSEVRVEQKDDKHRKGGTSPSYSLPSYEGFYEHPGYGVLAVEQKSGRLQIMLHGITYLLDHWHYDIFSIAEEFPDILFSRKGEKVAFHSNISGELEDVAISFDWGAPPILFKKKPDEKLSNLAYFRQFTDLYQFYNLMIEVAIRDQSLVALMPGQPLYELTPTAENEFRIREKPGYTIRFIKGPDGIVEEAQVKPPYGGTFSAKPKRLEH